MEASIKRLNGDVGGVRERYAQALAAFRALNDESGIAMVLGNLAELEFAEGHPEQALHPGIEVLEIHTRAKNAIDIATGYNNCAAYRIALGHLAAAGESARNGLRVARQARADQLVVIALQQFALLAGLGGEARRGAKLLGYVDVQYAALGMPRDPAEQWGYEKLMTALHEGLGANEIIQLAAEGAAWSEDQAVEEALKV